MSPYDVYTPASSAMSASAAVVQVPIKGPMRLFIFKVRKVMDHDLKIECLNQPGLPIAEVPDFTAQDWPGGPADIFDIPASLHKELATLADSMNHSLVGTPAWVFVAAGKYPGPGDETHYAAIFEKKGAVIDGATSAIFNGTTSASGRGGKESGVSNSCKTFTRSMTAKEDAHSGWADYSLHTTDLQNPPNSWETFTPPMTAKEGAHSGWGDYSLHTTDLQNPPNSWETFTPSMATKKNADWNEYFHHTTDLLTNNGAHSADEWDTDSHRGDSSIDNWGFGFVAGSRRIASQFNRDNATTTGWGASVDSGAKQAISCYCSNGANADKDDDKPSTFSDRFGMGLDDFLPLAPWIQAEIIKERKNKIWGGKLEKKNPKNESW